MLYMNCNKCGTPILPGENTCRFCGAIGDFSIRKEKPEIIGFDDIEDNYERINFALGEDEVSIIPETKPEPVVISDPITPAPVVAEPTPVVVQPVVESTPVVTEPVVIEPAPTVVSESVVEVQPTVVQSEVVQEVAPVVADVIMDTPSSIVEEVAAPVVEGPKIPVVNSVIDEPPTAKIPVEEVKKIVEAEKEAEVVEEVIETPAPVVTEPVVETKTEVVEEKKEDKKEEKKPTNYKGFCIVLAIFLAVSIVLNCFLLLKASGDSGIVKASENPLVSLKTVYKEYKFSLPYSWVVNGDDEEFLLIHNESESWAASISLESALEYDLVAGKEEEISSAFSKHAHAFTSNYVKTVNGMEFQIFKGKYYSHTVYLIINKIDEDTVAVTDVKFKGEVDDDIINDILKCLTNVSKVDMDKFSENDFEFENVTSVLEGIIGEEKEDK